MKNRIFLLLLCLLAASIMTANDGLYFPEGSKWTNAPGGASSIIQGDTVVESKTYHKVIDKYRDGEKLVALKREEGKKIYVRFEGTDTDVLLYDFGLEVGDSIVQHAEEFGFSWCQGPCTYHVEYIDTVTLLDGRKAKLIMYDGRMGDIEYVGCETGLFGPITMPDIPTGDYHYSYCFSIKGKPIYETSPGICRSCGYVNKLPSLCDEWNVAEKIRGIYHTFKWRLTTDTIINANHYVKIERNRQYKGALREDDNANIFIVPSDSTKEFLLYAFNAQVGDTLTNTCLGNKIIIKEIRPTTPRTIVLDVEYEWDYWDVNWIEGIGYSQGTPISYAYPLGSIHELDPPAMTVCAYKNGEQVYMADSTDVFGCDYYLHDDYPADTIPDNNIPLFARDDSGSSTVDPVDPNQVVASLKGNELIIQEFMGVEITYTLRHKEPAKTPSSHRAPQSDTFRDEVTIPITESGEYLLELTNPSWGYTIFGEFDYLPQGIETVHSNSTQHKVLLNGRLYIHHGDHIYDTQGKMIQ